MFLRRKIMKVYNKLAGDELSTIEYNRYALKDYEIIRCISYSVNPYTGKILTGISDDLKNKLMEISLILEKVNTSDAKFEKMNNKNIYNAGKKWTDEEDLKLIEEFKNGLGIKEIAKLHARKTGGIRSRLRKHKLID